jgi:peptide/nickel transport system substrate-binding protein
MIPGRLAAGLPARVLSGLIVACLIVSASALAASARDGNASLAQTGGPPDGQGGVLTFSPNFEPDSLDPHVAANSSSFIVLQNIVDTLVLLSPDDLEYHPYLAESWEISDDGTVYTFQLRDGVTFHDGTPFNAEAVKFNLDRIVNPETGSSLALTNLGPYGSSRVVDDLTIEITMETPYPPLLDALSQTALGMLSPAAVEAQGAAIGQNPVGTGFMKFVSWTPQDRIELVRNDDYNWAPDIWGHTGPAYLEGYTMVVADEAAARVTALESGDVLAIEDTPGQDVARLEADERFELVKAELPGHPRSWFMNTERAPLDDINVRKALLYGLNRPEIVQLATFGTQPAATGPFSPATWSYSQAAGEIYPYDPAMAGQLLDEAGWTMGPDGIRVKDGQPLSLRTIGFEVFRPLYEAGQSNAREIGVDMAIEIIATAAATEAAHRGDHHLAMTGVVASDPSNISLFYHSRNMDGFNWSRYHTPEFDKMWDDAAAELDRDTRLGMYEDIQEFIMNEALTIPTQVIVRNNFWSTRVKGARPDARGIYIWLYDAYVEPE